MSALTELIQESLPQLDFKIVVDTNSLHEFYNSRYPNGNYYKDIWDDISECFGDSKLQHFSFYENPEYEFEKLINEFIEAYPELDGSVYFYFSD